LPQKMGSTLPFTDAIVHVAGVPLSLLSPELLTSMSSSRVSGSPMPTSATSVFRSISAGPSQC
jgi:hypothetical protein